MNRLRHLLTIIMVIVATAIGWAQTSVTIGGTPVSSYSGEGVAWNEATGTLNLTDARIEGSVELTGQVQVVLDGDNNIELMDNGTCLVVNGNVTISGVGSLNCSCMEGNGILLGSNSTLTIRDCSVVASGQSWDAGGTSPVHPYIRLKNSTSVRPSLILRPPSMNFFGLFRKKYRKTHCRMRYIS